MLLTIAKRSALLEIYVSERRHTNFVAKHDGEQHRNEVLAVRHQREEPVHRDYFVAEGEHGGLRAERLDQHFHVFLDETPGKGVRSRGSRAAFR